MRPAVPNPAYSGARIGLGFVLLGYAVLLFILIGAVPGGSDNSGYFNEARLLAEGRIHTQERTLANLPANETPPYLYIPLGFKPAAEGSEQMVPTYPAGLALLLVPPARIAGWQHAGDIVLLIHSLAGIALTFALGRFCGLPGSWSLMGAAILAASPLYLFLSLQALSDVPATVWATAAVVSALRSRERAGWALASGACIAVGFLIRPSNFLVALPVLFAVGMSPRRLVLVAAGSIPGIAIWAAINHAAYGSSLQSGYGAIGNEFHASLIAGTFAYYAKWLPLLLSPVVLAAPAVVAFLRPKAPVAAVLASWAGAFIVFYSAYRWTHEQWWFLRFLLPAAPALIVAGLVVFNRWAGSLSKDGPRTWARLAPVLLLVAAVGVEVSRTNQLREAWHVGHGERKYGRVCAWLKAHVPEKSAMVTSQTSGALFYFTDFILLRFEEMKPGNSRTILKAAQSEGVDLYAVLFPFEQHVIKTLPGNWAQISSVDDVTIWHCSGSIR